MTPAFRAAALLMALATFLSGSARAEGEPDRDDRRDPIEDGRNEPDEKREVPDYDGRDDASTAGDVLLWGPRIVLAPPYLVSEYVLRRPLGFLIAGAERSGLPLLVYDFLTFGPDHKAGVFPTAFVDFGFLPSVGLYTFWNDAFVEGHDLRLRGATWGADWLSASFSERFRLNEDGTTRFALEASGLRRPDYTFFGLGPSSRQSALVRYGKDTLETRAFFETRLWRSSSFRAELALRDVNFRPGGYGADATLDEAIAAARFTAPPAYDRGYTLARSSVSAAFDTRLPRPAPGSGFRLALDGAHSAELRRTQSFVSYGGTVAGFVDVNSRQRVLSLAVTTKFVDPIRDADVPFTEQATLGGPQGMRGLYPDRLVDRSAAVAALSYHWPVWIFLDGVMNVEVGNVFGERLKGFEAGKLRWSGSIGVESNGTRDQAFQFLVGVGSETFESGGKVDSFRLAIGTTHGF